ncbi:hypothetical protein AB1Y20_022336 [Prymnesium parvum]|uniref:nucleoside-diphosphate kinase n=1 Tax=Prymnesium parvum TaxID=97485 RepID=A0AB34JFK6_PRYPA
MLSRCTYEGTRAQRTLVVFKPDTLQRGLLGELMQRFERRGFKPVGFKMLRPSMELARLHYEEHREKPFFSRACGFLASGPVVASAWEARGVIAAVRQMVGGTEPLENAPGTIRGDYGVHWRRNLIHSSSDEQTAAREVALWFRPDELVGWEQSVAEWLYELPPREAGE